MKIYDFNENLIIKKLQKKNKTILHNDSKTRIYTVSGKFIGEVCLVELPLVNKVFMCDKYQIRGDIIIATTLEDNYVSIINTKTGEKTKAQRIDVNKDKMIVTLENGTRRFIDESGKILEGEIGVGGFIENPLRPEVMTFSDENGSIMMDLECTFVDYYGKVKCGNSINKDGIYTAYSSASRQKVFYSFLGNIIEEKDFKMYRDLYKFFNGKIKIDSLNDEYLLDANAYNFIVDEVNKRLQNKFNQTTDIKGYYDKTAQQILGKLEQTLRDLEERRKLALENSVNQTLENNTFEN